MPIRRTRAIEREDGDDVLEAVGPHLLQEFDHARRFELEDARRLAFLKESIGLRVVEGMRSISISRPVVDFTLRSA
jgi:hypothetical protein